MKILDVNPFNRAQTPNSRTLSSAHAREKPGHRYSPSFPLENLLIVYKTTQFSGLELLRPLLKFPLKLFRFILVGE